MTETPTARLLIVDDEQAQMKALCDTLREHGHETVGFASSKSALESIEAGRYDLLLSDLMMPELDGIGLVRAASERDPSLVCIVMTGQGTIDTAVEAMKAGALDYILKPFKLSIILPVLSRALAIRRLRQENETLHRQLRERAAELEAANKELEAFSHSVSHDLRAPLRAIDGFSQMLLDSHLAALPEDAQRLLSGIGRNARRMDALINDLLRFSKLNRQQLARTTVDMNALVREALEELRAGAPERPVTVRVGDLPPCVGDRSLLRQVWVNLIGNAWKYTRSKDPGAVIEVGYGPLMPAAALAGDAKPADATSTGPVMTCFVRDNGAGFDMRYAGKMFGVFQRLHSEKEFEGTGVGLSIVQRIIHRHGGHIWAEGKVGEGATFYFTVPANTD